MVRIHTEKIKILDGQLKNAKKRNTNASVISPDNVLKIVQDLYKLKINGKLIEGMYNSQQKHRQNEALLFNEKNVDDTKNWYSGLKSKLKNITFRR